MRIREFSWWTFYVLFIGIVIFLLFLMVRVMVGGALATISNTGLFIYYIGLLMVIFGLMAMCVGYIVRVTRYKLRGNRGEPPGRDRSGGG
jgi:hypothetical protein